MVVMNQRQRLMAFLNNEPLDRVPIWMLFPYHRLGCYADIFHLTDYQPIVNLALEKTVWLDRRHIGAPLYTPEVTYHTEEETKGNIFIRRSVLEYRGMRLTRESYNSSAGSSQKNYLASETDVWQESHSTLPRTD